MKNIIQNTLPRRSNFLSKRSGLLLALCVLVFAMPSADAAVYGQLQVSNGQLRDSSGAPVQLTGVSSHGLQWYPFQTSTVNHLVDQWGITVVRAAMYTEQGGYISNPTTMKNRVKTIVDAAIAKGIYVIIDWHILYDGDPNTYKNQAKAFFEEMATLYGNYPNIIYEICNEPNGSGVTWNGSIKPYAEFIIPAIRAIDPNNVIIVGTSNWSQGVRAAADNPLSFTNVMYALHFYAGTHGAWLRNEADYALSQGAAIFVSEWGTTDATGQGAPHVSSSQVWMDWMNNRGLSWVNWSFSPDAGGSSALKQGVSLSGPWVNSNYTASGEWVKARIGVPSIADGESYNLINAQSSKRLHESALAYASNPQGKYVITFPNQNGAAAQRWKFESVGSGNYRIRNWQSSHALHESAEVYAQHSNGRYAITFPWSGWDTQRWKPVSLSGGYFRFENVFSGQTLHEASEVYSPNPNGQMTITFPYDGWNSQKWSVVKGGF